MLSRLILILTLWGATVAADVPLRMEQAFRDWAAQVGTPRAVMTLWQDGTRLHDVALGMGAQDPVPLASLSKAYTALCAITLVDQGRWGLETTSAEVLGYGTTSVSLAQLLTHTGGILPDQTQGLGMLGRLGTISAGDFVARRALGRKAQDGTPGVYAYSNENYIILGEMIAAKTGQSYQSYCDEAVLGPAGVTSAIPAAPIAGLLSAGGWQMSVQDYARLIHWGFGPEGIVGRALESWPQTEIGGGAFYGVGMAHRPFQDSYNFWHFGQLCFPFRAEAGSYVAQWEQKWLAVTAFDGCLDWDDMFRLDAMLSKALYP